MSARIAALEAQLDAAFDEVIKRIRQLIADCPARKCRATDHNSLQGEPHAL